MSGHGQTGNMECILHWGVSGSGLIRPRARVPRWAMRRRRKGDQLQRPAGPSFVGWFTMPWPVPDTGIGNPAAYLLTSSFLHVFLIRKNDQVCRNVQDDPGDHASVEACCEDVHRHHPHCQLSLPSFPPPGRKEVHGVHDEHDLFKVRVSARPRVILRHCRRRRSLAFGEETYSRTEEGGEGMFWGFLVWPGQYKLAVSLFAVRDETLGKPSDT